MSENTIFHISRAFFVFERDADSELTTALIAIKRNQLIRLFLRNFCLFCCRIFSIFIKHLTLNTMYAYATRLNTIISMRQQSMCKSEVYQFGTINYPQYIL